MQRVATIDEYLAWCASIKTKGNKLYRGQIRDYGKVVPSQFRGAERAPNAHELIAEIYMTAYAFGNWAAIEQRRLEAFEQSFNPIGGYFPDFKIRPWFDPEELSMEIAGHGFGEFIDREYYTSVLSSRFEEHLARHGDALLQHYGVPSPGLDVSFDPTIALWFASHPYNVASDDKVFHSDTMKNDGVVYIFDAGAAELEIEDLRSVLTDSNRTFDISIPYFGLRGVAQQGALLFGATTNEPDMGKWITAKCAVVPGIWDTFPEARSRPSYRDIIPDIEADPFYAMLLREKKTPSSKFAAILTSIREYLYAAPQG